MFTKVGGPGLSYVQSCLTYCAHTHTDRSSISLFRKPLVITGTDLVKPDALKTDCNSVKEVKDVSNVNNVSKQISHNITREQKFIATNIDLLPFKRNQQHAFESVR